MSDKPKHDWLACVVSSDLAPTTRHVLVTLSMHMDLWGESCYPTIDQLVFETGLGRSTVITHLQKAEALGWLVKKEHGFSGQKWRNHEYKSTKPDGAKVTQWKDSALYLKKRERGTRATPRQKEKVVQLLDHHKDKGGPALDKGGPSADERWSSSRAKVVREMDPSIPTSSSLSSSLSIPSSQPPEKQEPSKAKPAVPKSTATWNAYAKAFQARYGAEPIRDASINSILCKFVDKIPNGNAPAVAEFYISHNSRFYVEAKHPVNLLLRDVQKIHTDWATGMQTTSTQAQQLDRKQNNLSVGQQVLESRKERGLIHE